MTTKRIRKGTTLTVARDSEDLGLDKGTRVRVLRVRGHQMDLAADGITIANVEIDHRDLVIA